MSGLAVHQSLPDYRQPTMTNQGRSIFAPPRNPNLAKWEILFDKKIAEWISFKPQLGLQVYPCYACRDMFGSKNSFLDHVNRRGILLKYKCNFCPESEALVFYNPCSFLLHTRQHYTLLGGLINLESLEVSLLPFGLGGFLPDPSVPLLYHVEDDNVGEALFINTRFYSPMNECMGKPVVNLVPNELLFFYSSEPSTPSTSLVLKQMSSNIPRCKFVVLDNNRFTPVPSGVDIRGKQLMPTSTIVNENNNDNSVEIEIKQEPLDSPEDSIQYSMPIITKIETIDETETEAKQTPACEKFPRCPECKQIQTVSMGEHFLRTNKPFQDSLKCSICKYIAPTQCSLEAHERIHDGVAPYVCPECGKDFGSRDLLHAHLEEVCFHLTKQVRMRCPGKKCGKIFAQNITFATHFLVHMQCLAKCITCNITFATREECLAHCQVHRVKSSAIKVYKCTVCSHLNETFTSSNYQEHIHEHTVSKRQCLYVYICKRCHSYFRSTLTYAAHLLRCTKPLPHSNTNLSARKDLTPSVEIKRKRKSNAIQVITGICLTCNTQIKIQVQSYDKAPTQCPHCGDPLSYAENPLKNNVFTLFQRSTEEPLPVLKTYSMQNMTACILCEKTMNERELNHHMEFTCKYYKPLIVLEPVNVSTIPSNNPSPKSDESLRKKRRRVTYSKFRKSSAGNSETEVPIEVDEPEPFDGTYKCKLCDYSITDRQSFHEHVIKHRNVSTSYQCMECGDCFVVRPSLVKHLLFYHQIYDAETYFNENDCFNKEAVKELEISMRLPPGKSRKPLQENQCGECYKIFNNSSELTIHLRVHGMAFLRSNSK